MKAFLTRRPLLIGLILLGVIGTAFRWLASDSGQAVPARLTRPAKQVGPDKPNGARNVGAPRSILGLTLDDKQDVSADGRPPDARRESIIRTGLGEIQEMQQMNKPIFDEAAKRWNAQPRVKELIAQWKDVEENWKTLDDAAKEATVPRMEAMWKEALGLLRSEVEQSAREAGGAVK